MNSLSQVPLLDFQKALTPEKVRSIQSIHLGLGLGVFGFGLVVLYLCFFQRTEHEPVSSDFDLVQILTIIHLAVSIPLVFLSAFLYNRQFTPERLQVYATTPFRSPEGAVIDDPVEKCLSLIRTAVIVRLAFLEGAAFFGLVVCTIAILNGIMPGHAEYAVNAVTPLVFLIVVTLSFPNTERLEEIFKTKIAASGTSSRYGG